MFKSFSFPFSLSRSLFLAISREERVFVCGVCVCSFHLFSLFFLVDSFVAHLHIGLNESL